MATNEHRMDPNEVRRLLDVLKQRLTDEGIDARVHVIGCGDANANGASFIPPASRVPLDPTGVTATIATIEELIAMKLAASRDQDLFDLGILARHAGIADPERLVDIAFAAYGEDSLVLTDTREDYLIMARQAIEAERKRARNAAAR